MPSGTSSLDVFLDRGSLRRGSQILVHRLPEGAPVANTRISLYGDESRNWQPMLGDRDNLPTLHSLQQREQVRPGLEGPSEDRHGASLRQNQPVIKYLEFLGLAPDSSDHIPNRSRCRRWDYRRPTWGLEVVGLRT
jgi:hypothetical protein